jgi:hypothetical protein
MDYYAAWPVWKMPKWMGVALGGIFSVIAGGSIWLIVDLTRPPQHRAITAVATPAVAPKVVEPAAPVPALAPATPEPATVAVASSPAEKPTAKKNPSPVHKRAILAKHDAKTAGMTKTEFDRLLGL